MGKVVSCRRGLTEGGVSSMGVVPTLDKLEHRLAGLFERTEGAAIKEFALQSGKEALTQGIVVAISKRSHRRANAGLATALPEGQRGVLAPLVRVVDDPMGASLVEGHLQGIHHQLGAQVTGHGPTHHSATPGIQHDHLRGPGTGRRKPTLHRNGPAGPQSLHPRRVKIVVLGVCYGQIVDRHSLDREPNPASSHSGRHCRSFRPIHFGGGRCTQSEST